MNESSEFFVRKHVHKESTHFAVLTETSPSPVLQVRKPNTRKAVDENLDKLYVQGTVFARYEAGPCGYGLARYIESKGIQCEVLGQSKIRRKLGERRTIDRRYSSKLAKLLRYDRASCEHKPWTQPYMKWLSVWIWASFFSPMYYAGVLVALSIYSWS